MPFPQCTVLPNRRLRARKRRSPEGPIALANGGGAALESRPIDEETTHARRCHRLNAGDSTLLNLLAGLDRPNSGSVAWHGEAVSTLSEDALAKRRQGAIGFVFQSFQLLPALTALENVMLPLELAGARDAEKRAADWLTRVGLGERVDHLPKQLSGGEQQRVAIARAFVAEPKIVFADEPTGNLDTDTGAEIIELMFSLNREQGTTLVLVTHDPDLAARCAHVVRLARGKVVS